MYRIIGFFMALVITFTACCVPAYADTEDNPPTPSDAAQAITDLCNNMTIGWDDFSRDCWQALGQFSEQARPIICTYDTTVGVIGAGLKYFRQLVRSGSTPEQALQTMNNSITINGDGNTVITGDGASFCDDYYSNGFLNGTGGSLSDLKYVDRFIPGYDFLNPAYFSNSNLYYGAKNIMKNNPDYVFSISSSSNVVGGYPAGNFYLCACKKPILGGVLPKNEWGLPSAGAYIYADDWSNNFIGSSGDWVSIRISGTSVADNVKIEVCVGEGYEGNAYSGYGDFETVYEGVGSRASVDLDDYYDSNVNQSANTSIPNYIVTYDSIQSIAKDYQLNQRLWDSTIFTGSSGRGAVLTCFSTLQDLKKGTVGLSTAQVLPSYTGNGINGPITDSQITQARDIINNYYQDGTPQGGSGNNNNGNGNGNGSGSGWLDSLLDGLGSVGQALVKILGELLSIIGDAVTAIVNAISGVLDILHTGFIDMLSAVFPFLPQEFWTVVLLALSLGLLGLIIKFFRG